MRPTQERYLEDKPNSNKMGNNKEGAINNKRSVLVTTLNNFVVTNDWVREFTTNSLDMGTRRTVKTNNTMLPSTPISTSTSWTTPSPHPTTQTGSPTTRLPSTSTSWTTPSPHSTTQTWSPTESTPTTRLPSTSTSWTTPSSQSTLRIGHRWGRQCHRLRDPRQPGQRRVQQHRRCGHW